ncbi:MAG: lipoyl(octanoyl) transferase LipB [Thermodesulfobacteriota bacterium]
MLLVDLPCTEYRDALRSQQAIIERKLLRGGPDTLLLLEHPPTITLGKRGLDSHVLMPRDQLKARGVALYNVDRGGGATYHGPGQLVGYPILDLKNPRRRIRDYVSMLEETIIRTMEHFGASGFRQEGKVGVWTGTHDKIASIGIRIRRGITSHGFSLNVDLDMDPQELIISCDMPDARMVSLNQLLETPVNLEWVKEAIAREFSVVFNVWLERSSLERALA